MTPSAGANNKRSHSSQVFELKQNESITFAQSSTYAFGYFTATENEDGTWNRTLDSGWSNETNKKANFNGTVTTDATVTITMNADYSIFINAKRIDGKAMTDEDRAAIAGLISVTQF